MSKSTDVRTYFHPVCGYCGMDAVEVYWTVHAPLKWISWKAGWDEYFEAGTGDATKLYEGERSFRCTNCTADSLRPTRSEINDRPPLLEEGA